MYRIPSKRKIAATTPTMLPQICHKPKFPIIISAYTVTSHLGDYYKKAVKRLASSCIKFDLQHIIFPLSGVNDWITGCALKPTMILYALQTFKIPVLWIDADGEIFNYPGMFDKTNFDIALGTDNGTPNGHWLSGTLYCSQACIPFVEEWKRITVPPHPDEITLLNLYRQNQHGLKLQFLPLSYNHVVYQGVDTTKLTIGHYMRPDVAPCRGVSAIPVG